MGLGPLHLKQICPNCQMQSKAPGLLQQAAVQPYVEIECKVSLRVSVPTVATCRHLLLVWKLKGEAEPGEATWEQEKEAHCLGYGPAALLK